MSFEAGQKLRLTSALYGLRKGATVTVMEASPASLVIAHGHAIREWPIPPEGLPLCAVPAMPQSMTVTLQEKRAASEMLREHEARTGDPF